jgi:hypothetical protein
MSEGARWFGGAVELRGFTIGLHRHGSHQRSGPDNGIGPSNGSEY